MALTKSQRATLDKVSRDFNGLITPADAVKGAVQGKVGDSITKLKNMTFSSPATLATAISDFSSDVSNVVPGTSPSDIEEIYDMIKDCSYLDDQGDAAATVMKVINNTTKSIFDKIGSIAFDISVTVPEFDVSGLLDDVTSLFDGLSFPNVPDIKVPNQFDLTNIMKGADKLINCLDILGQGEYNNEVTTYSATLTDLYTDLGMVSNPVDPNYGKLDIDSVYSAASLTPTQQASINATQASYKAVKDASVSSVSDALATAKSMKKLGTL
ncbi:MAG: hypothetical protein ACTSX1_00120 [Candidatus Heimdallarchaeaceae archaeon]